MTHVNAPLTPTGRLRMVLRHIEDGIPKAHVAAEFRVSRPTVATWVTRYLQHGEAGLVDRPSTPHESRTRTPAAVVELIETLRRKRKWSARRIHRHLIDRAVAISLRTVGRWLHRLGISRLRDLTPEGESSRRTPRRIRAAWPGHMIHLDVKKVGKIPDGGGWRLHGRDCDQTRAANRAKKGQRVGYTYFHSAIDGFSRLAYTEALPDEKATTLIGFWARARAWFTAHGIKRITRLVTDNGPCYKSHAFNRSIAAHVARHQYIRAYTPRHNGKVERYNRILAEEFLYAHPFTTDTQRSQAIQAWNIHYNYHRTHTACGNQPPATRTPTRVTNVMTSNT